MDLFLLISWIVEIISQCIQTSKLHVVHLKYIYLAFPRTCSIQSRYGIPVGDRRKTVDSGEGNPKKWAFQ